MTREEVKAAGKINVAPYSMLSEAYLAMANDTLKYLKLFHSDVIFARYALWKHTGFWFPLDRVEDAMRAEGWIERSYRRY
jgi:hypothetical protein